MKHSSATLFDEQLLRRVYSEYLEMPGLRLTMPQARRLFGLSEHTCVHLLDHLVARRLLVRRANGTYLRPTDGGAGFLQWPADTPPIFSK